MAEEFWHLLTPYQANAILASPDARWSAAMFTRRDVSILAGMPAGKLKTHLQRDQLPFLSAFEVGDPRADTVEKRAKPVRAWNRFSRLEVLAVAITHRLSCQVGYASGIPWETAAKIVSNDIHSVEFAVSHTGDDDFWMGYIGHPVDRGDDLGGLNVSGGLADVCAKVQSLELDGAANPVRIFLVNVSEVIREVEHRAGAAGLKFTLDQD